MYLIPLLLIVFLILFFHFRRKRTETEVFFVKHRMKILRKRIKEWKKLGFRLMERYK